MRSQRLEQYMDQALAESEKALPLCGDNPPVGCVIVQDDQVIACGHTQKPGQAHAEAMALRALLPENKQRLEAFVTLEPCSFHGRTPSCAKALVTAGIAKVYVGMLDPDPRNAGKGVEILRAAGVEVQLGVYEGPVSAFLRPYLQHHYCTEGL